MPVRTISRHATWQVAAWTIVCLSVLLPHDASAADIVYLTTAATPAAAQQQVATVARFYGLDLKTELLGETGTVKRVLRDVAEPSTLGVVIDAEALQAINRSQVFAATLRRKHAVPVLLAGINIRTPAADLKLWSSESISSASHFPAARGWEEVGAANEVTGQLSGTRLPLAPEPVDTLEVTSPAHVERLLTATQGDVSRPIFLRVREGAQDIFFATAATASDLLASPDPFHQQAVFAGMAPLLLFLRYAAGDHAWHSPGAYANFTVDDLWLREPYGHVNYEQLVAEATQHKFHTTIAFIPWNFDRSQPGVVSLFREHPDRLSIAIHGNDHIHQEFGPLERHPLPEQKWNLEQGLARMRRFQQLTGLPYDSVMIFPHSVSPEATFSALKQANFLSTVNSLAVPSDQSAPNDAEFALRTATLRFAGFSSLRRYSVESEIPKAQLAIDAFLGNPMLFYAHESFFAAGENAFDPVADEVNQLQPTTRWTGLGEIMHHLYLERLRDDGDVAIRSYSPVIRLHNGSQRTVNFWIEKEERFDSPVMVLLDGHTAAYERSETGLRLRLAIAPGKDHLVEVRYGAPMNLAAVDLSSHSLRVALIRILSDYRDNAVSRTMPGRWFIRSYAASAALWDWLAIAVVASLCGGSIAACYRRGSARPS